MCSTIGGQLGRICRAIDELAASSGSEDDAAGGSAPATREDGAAQAGSPRREGRDDTDMARLAAIWEMVADADPELAKRLPGYLSAADLAHVSKHLNGP
jgi:hypothetical protein